MSAEAIKGANLSKEEQELVEMLHEAVNGGHVFMGDDIIGYKFPGRSGETFNIVLRAEYNDFPITLKWLQSHGLNPVPFDTKIWNSY